MSHARIRQYEKAIPRLEQALSQQPDSYEALYYLGVSHARSERPSRANTHFEKLVELNPEDIEALTSWGGITYSFLPPASSDRTDPPKDTFFFRRWLNSLKPKGRRHKRSSGTTSGLSRPDQATRTFAGNWRKCSCAGTI